MDAAEDRDIKFHRASGDLIKDLTESLPSLLWKPKILNGQNVVVVRRWANAVKADRLQSLVRAQNPRTTNQARRLFRFADEWCKIARAVSRMASASRPASAEVAAFFGGRFLSLFGQIQRTIRF